MYNFIFNINKNSKKKGAKIPLKIRYYESRDKRIQIDTGIKIALRHWSDSKKALKNTSEIKDSYIEFDRQNRLAQKIVNYYKENKKPLTCTKFKYHFKSEDLTEFNHKQLTFFEELDYFIESKKSNVVQDVIKDYKTLKKHLLCYESFDDTILDFDRINYSFYQKWCDFLAYHYEKKNGELGLKNNSIGKSVKNLKAFLNHSMRTNRIKKIDLSGFVAIQEEVDHIYLNEKEIQSISDLSIYNDKELETVRDFFIIGCYTGLRFSDISRIKPEYITNGLLSLRQKKTSGKVVIPIRKPALKALARYNFYAPQVNSLIFNKRIKQLGKQAEINSMVELEYKKGANKEVKIYKKYELISSHTCRRSFCTNAYLEGIDVQLIMKISGHKTEKAFMRYLKISSLEAAYKLQDAWGV